MRKFIIGLLAATLSSTAYASSGFSAPTPATNLFGWLDKTMLPTLANGVAHLAQTIAPLMQTAITLYFVIWCVRIIKDDSQDKMFNDLLWHFFTLSFVTFFAFNSKYYVSHIIPMVNDIPSELAKVFSGSEGKSLVNAIDDAFVQNTEIIGDMWSKTRTVSWSGISVSNIMMAIRASVVIEVLGDIYIAIGLLIAMISKLMVNVILALGPIYICAAFFPSTRQYFTLWVNQLVNYMLLTMLISIVFVIQLTITNGIVEPDGDGNLSPFVIGSLAILYIVCLGTIVVIPVLASSLSGGMGLNGLVGNTLGLAAAPFRMASSSFSALSKGPGNLGKNTMGPASKMARPG